MLTVDLRFEVERYSFLRYDEERMLDGKQEEGRTEGLFLKAPGRTNVDQLRGYASITSAWIEAGDDWQHREEVEWKVVMFTTMIIEPMFFLSRVRRLLIMKRITLDGCACGMVKSARW